MIWNLALWGCFRPLVQVRVMHVRTCFFLLIFIQGLILWWMHLRHQRQLQKQKEPSPLDCLAPVNTPFRRVHEVLNASSAGSCNVLCNLMTTFIEDDVDAGKQLAQENVLRSFKNLQPYGVRAWLFTESEEWAEKAAAHGVEVVRKFRTNKVGTPCLNFMYQYVAENDQCAKNNSIVFDGYVNGDILFTKTLVETLQTIRDSWQDAILAGERNGVLVSGVRTNTPLKTEQLDTDASIVRFAKGGTPFRLDAQDFFIYSRGAVDWDEMPGFVVGRLAYDNWLIDDAFHRKDVDLIDVSRTLLAVHQTTADGNSAGHKKPLSDRFFNQHARNPRTDSEVSWMEWDHGRLNFAHFFTMRDASGRIAVHPSIGSRCRTLPSLSHTAPPVPPPLLPTPSSSSPSTLAEATGTGGWERGKERCLANLMVVLGDDADDVSNLYGAVRDKVREAWEAVRTRVLGKGSKPRPSFEFVQTHAGDDAERDEMVIARLAELRALGVRVWVMTTSAHWARRAASEGMEVMHAARTYAEIRGNPNLRPIVKVMFREMRKLDAACNNTFVLDGFIGRGLAFVDPRAMAQTLERVQAEWAPAVAEQKRFGVCVIGKRKEVPYMSGRPLSSVEQWADAVSAGVWSSNRVIDFVLCSRDGGHDWSETPTFDYRHPGFMANILQRLYNYGFDIVDGTSTLTAVHLHRMPWPTMWRRARRWLGLAAPEDGERLGGGNDHDNNQLNVRQREVGSTDHAHFFTRRNASGGVSLLVRSHHLCRSVPARTEHAGLEHDSVGVG